MGTFNTQFLIHLIIQNVLNQIFQKQNGDLSMGSNACTSHFGLVYIVFRSFFIQEPITEVVLSTRFSFFNALSYRFCF